MSAVMVEQIESDDVDVALEAWARWAKQAFTGLGWPTISIIGKVVEFGLMGAAQSAGVRPVEVDPLCELVDKAIKEQLTPMERRVVVVFYTKWLPREGYARACGVTETNFRQLLYRARRSVKAYLAGASLRYHDSPATL